MRKRRRLRRRRPCVHAGRGKRAWLQEEKQEEEADEAVEEE